MVVVTGLRQSGKSTLLTEQEDLRGRRYVSLDEFAQLAAAQRNPDAFVDVEQPLTIDEAQRCPELFLAIKRAVDRDRAAGRYLLSGSVNLALLERVSESLAGRAVYLTLHPFHRRELAGGGPGPPVLRLLLENPQAAAERALRRVTTADVLRGGMPPVALGQIAEPALWFQGYHQAYLERDVRELSRVTDLVGFRQLLRLAALRTGQVLKVSEIGRDAKMSATTAGRYLSLLEASFVVRRLPPYLGNRSRRVIKSPKLYVSDSGLAASLMGIDDVSQAADDPLFGALLETYVAHNLSALIEAHWPRAQLHYWHVQGRHEVDFVIESGRSCVAIEVKRSSRWRQRDLSGLRAFRDSTPHCRAAILAYQGDSTVELGDRLWAIPLATVLS